jgi:hypothetical protein
LTAFAPAVIGQGGATAVQRRATPTINLDLAKRTFDQPLPFHETFRVIGNIPAEADSFSISFGPLYPTRCKCGESGSIEDIESKHPRVLKSSTFDMIVGNMEPNRPYRFRFLVWKFITPNHVDTVSHSVITDSDRGTVTTSTVVKLAAPRATTSRAVADTIDIIAEAKAPFTSHFDADVGVLRTHRTGYWGLATNAHFHLVPLNKNEDLSQLSPLQKVMRRLSVFGGLAVREMATEKEVRPYFAGVGSPVAGLGYRGTGRFDPVRINGGVMFFKEKDANPLVDRELNKRDTFVSLSVDFDVKTLLVPLALLLH